jgi:phosphoribosylformylglycinamidine synthase
MKARVFVTLRPSILDPQGKTILSALHSLGYDAVENVRQGKFFEIEIAAPAAGEARALAAEMADRLLSNPVIESYRVEVDDQESAP